MAILINCDDLGMHPAANEGTCRLLQGGVIRSASIMAVGQAFTDAVERLRSIGAREVGVHLVATSEYRQLPTRPLTDLRRVRSLIGTDGTFPSQVADLTARCRLEELREEWQAQITRVKESGFTISHLDGHMYCYEPAQVGREDLLALVQEFADELRVPYRCGERPQPFAPQSIIMIWKETESFAERSAFYEQLLSSPPSELAELIIHPAVPDTDLSARLRKAERRYADFRFFSSPTFRELAHTCEIVAWKDLSRHSVP